MNLDLLLYQNTNKLGKLKTYIVVEYKGLIRKKRISSNIGLNAEYRNCLPIIIQKNIQSISSFRKFQKIYKQENLFLRCVHRADAL